MQRNSEARSTAWRQGERARTAALAGNRQVDDTTFCNARGQVVGRLRGGWLCKAVNTAKHQLRTPPAWALDAMHLDLLRQVGASGVQLTDETGRTWKATVGAFDAHGIPLDRGHGRQVALPLTCWQVARPGEAEQLSMFGEVG